jgi:hypothetical protein
VSDRVHAVVNRALMTVAVTLFGVALVVACGAGQRDKALRGSFAAVNAAREGFQVWDAAHQATLVEAAATEEAGAQALADYRAARVPVVAALEAAYHALALAVVDDKASAEALAELVALAKAVEDLRASVSASGP